MKRMKITYYLLIILTSSSFAQNDTIAINGLSGIISSIDSTDYYSSLISEKNVLRFQYGPFENKDFNEIEKESLVNKKYVFRKADTLYFKLNNGKFKTLINKPFTGESAVKYQYIDFIKEINFYVIFAQGWESSYLILINIESGSVTQTSTEITIYPEHNTIIGTQYDLDIGFYYNQIENFKIENKELRLQWRYRAQNWGFYNPILFRSDLIYFKKITRESGARKDKTILSRLEIK